MNLVKHGDVDVERKTGLLFGRAFFALLLVYKDNSSNFILELLTGRNKEGL